MARTVALTYLRVSRGRTHRKNLEIFDQRIQCLAFAQRNGFVIREEFVEIEMGKGSDSLAARPKLEECVRLARRTGAPILVASIDRIARNVNFLDELLLMKVAFIVTQSKAMLLSDASRRFARIASHDSSPAEQAVGAGPAHHRLTEAARMGHRALQDQADCFALAVFPEIQRIQAAGAGTLLNVADELTRRGVPTARGGKWTPTAVRRVIKRVDAIRD